MSLVDRVREIAVEAGELLGGHYGTLRRADASRKSTRRDLVSEADLASERFLLAQIPKEDNVLSEEGHGRETGAGRTWIIDPLDGTVNFLHGLPNWCVSVGVVEDGRLVAGAVSAPELRLTWCASEGHGCFCNGERVHVSETAELAESILATGFAYERNELPDNNFDNFTELGLAAAGIRRMGAAAIDLAFVACGRLDGFWELHLQPWDVAAGALLIREAGGQVSDFHGGEALDDVLFKRHIVASNGRNHDAIRARLAPLKGLA